MNRHFNSLLAEMALGKRKADFVIKNGRVVNVFTNEIEKADIAIAQGRILGVGTYHGERELDASGKIICPGFVDAHLHLESTLVRPAELIERAGRKGTTTFIVDPHEAANVAGLKGIVYILDQTEAVMANVYVMMPSCVPAVEFEDNGAVLLAEDMKELLHHPRVLGLGEVMDSASVMEAEGSMVDKLDLFRDRMIDGHAGTLTDPQLMCYKLAGIGTDHECSDYETALREARAGLQVLIREGTGAKNLEAIVRGLVANHIPLERFSFCTDDKHIAEIEEQGHIGWNIRKAVSLGVLPIEAVKMATIYTARAYGLTEIGAIAPGYQADLVILDDLETVQIDRVFFKGEEVGTKKTLPTRAVDEKLLHTVHTGPIDLHSFKMKVTSPVQSIIGLIDGQILTKKEMEEIPVKQGFFQADFRYNKAAVFERHKATGKRGLGIVKGFGIRNGAVASTFCHDSHNLIVVGDNDRDMLLAAEEILRCRGGYTIIENGAVAATLPLPVMGLIGELPHSEITATLAVMLDKLREMGVAPGIDPFITLSFLTLPVIGQIRITARGVYDVEAEQWIN